MPRITKKIWTGQVQVDREILEQLGPNSSPQVDLTPEEVTEMEQIVEECRERLEKFGYVRTQTMLGFPEES